MPEYTQPSLTPPTPHTPPQQPDGGSMLDRFYAILDGMSESEREEVLAALSRDYPGRRAAIRQDAARAEDLANTRGPGMRRAGRFVVAAHPLEHIAALGQRGVGEVGLSRARSRREALSRGWEQGLGAAQRAMFTR